MNVYPLICKSESGAGAQYEGAGIQYEDSGANVEVLESNMQIPEPQRKTEQKGAERRLSGAVVCRSGAEGPEARSGTEAYHGSRKSEWSGFLFRFPL